MLTFSPRWTFCGPVRESTTNGELILSTLLRSGLTSHSVIEQLPNGDVRVERANNTVTARNVPALLVLLNLVDFEPGPVSEKSSQIAARSNSPASSTLKKSKTKTTQRSSSADRTDPPPAVADVRLVINSSTVTVRMDPKTGREQFVAISPRATVLRGRWQAGSAQRALIADWVDQYGDETVSVALKQLSKPLSEKALAAWAKLRHLNVVPLFGEIKHGSVQRLVMPFVNGGSLRERLNDDLADNNEDETASASGSEQFQIGVLLDVATALDYLHRNDIIHRDVAARNVLLRRSTTNDAQRALLCGFALTRDVSGDTDSVYVAGNFDVPLQPLAPEQLEDYANCREGCRSSAASDVWAFGCLAAEMMLPHVSDFYEPIVCDINKRDKRGWMLAVFEHIAMQRRTPIDLHHDDLSSALPAVLAIVKCCFEHDERLRPRIDEIRRLLVDAGRARLPRSAARQERAATLYRDAEPLPVEETRAVVAAATTATANNSELEIWQREWIELERDFATKMAALDDGYSKNLFAATFSAVPPLAMPVAERLFANVSQLRRAADQFHDALAAVDRTRNTLVAAAGEALAKSRFVERLSAFLASEPDSQRLLMQLLEGKDGDRKAVRAREECVRILSLVQLNPKVSGQSLGELLACPHRHSDAQRRMVVLLATAAAAAGDKQAASAFGALGAQLAAAKTKDDSAAETQHAAQVLAELKWNRKQLRANDFDGSERVSNLFVGRSEHRLVLDGVAGVRWEGAKKHAPHTLLLFDDALLVCDKKRKFVLAALDLSHCRRTTVDSLGPTAFEFVSIDVTNGRRFAMEVLCGARRDTHRWRDSIAVAVEYLGKQETLRRKTSNSIVSNSKSKK